MDSVEVAFAITSLALGSVSVGVAVWALIKPPGPLSRWPATHQNRVAAGEVLIGVGMFLQVPRIALGALNQERPLADLVSVACFLFMLAGAGVLLWASLGAREIGRS